MARILVVDDDRKTVSTIALYLRNDGHIVEEAYSGIQAIEKFRGTAPDLVVLDVMLPTIDGIDVTRLIRLESDVPILLLTARTFEDDKLKGFSEGIDDYVTKPFSPRELVARIRALLRRAGRHARDDSTVTAFDITVSPATRQVTVAGERVQVTKTEFAILHVMACEPGRVFTRSELVRHAFGQDYEGLDRSVDTHLSNLRRKLGRRGASAIQTVHGVGYKLQDPERA